MTYKQAKKKFDKLAGKRYRSIGYTLTTHSDGKEIQECYLYVDPSISVSASTWAEALAVMEGKLTGKSRVEDVGNVPELVNEEVGENG